MYRVFLSLGSNIEPREENLFSAIKALKEFSSNFILSSIYETEPVGDIDQNDFLNMVVYCETDFDVYEFHKKSKEIENILGRVRDLSRPKGPRNIDIDIIFFDRLKINNENIIIPHKLYRERNFVLIPLIETLEMVDFDFVDINELRSCVNKNQSKYVKIFKDKKDIVL